MAAPAPPPAANPFPTCPNLGYQMQSQTGETSDLGYFDLNTSLFVPIGGVGQSINAFGYSRAQRVFWGMRTNPLNDTLVRIDSKGVTTDLGPLDYNPPFTATRTNTGTIDDQDRLIIHTQQPANEVVVVDVDPVGGPAGVGTVISRTPLSRTTPGMTFLRIGDWDFNPDDGLLYSLEMQGNTVRMLVSINPTTGVVTDVKDMSAVLPDGNNYGAVYVEDFSGVVYVSNNDVDDLLAHGLPGARSQTFGIYTKQNYQVIPYTPGAPLLINDGADCLVATDFGDAPDTYKTLNPNGGPGHIFSEVGDPNTSAFDPNRHLRAGSLIDSDLDGIPTPNADGDDLNLPVNDEDGVPAGTVIDTGAPSLTVPTTNTTNAPAVLAGWVDFNGNGMFDASERATVPVPVAGGPVTLNWTPATAGTPDSYLRLRLYEAADPLSGDPQPTGADFALGGEIEDHKVKLVGPAPTQLPVTGTNVGDLVKAGVLLVICGGLGFAMGGRPTPPRRRPSPRPRLIA
jgi:hypothetical protein